MENWNEPSTGEGKRVSRREFLKIAGIAGATVGVGAGLGGLVAACGAEETTTTTAGATTTISSEAEMGREIKIGLVSPQTGPAAAFGVPDGYSITRWEEATKDGVALGDGKKHTFKFLLRDTQGDVNRAATVAGDLINNDKVDMIVVASAPDTVLPTVDTCESMGVPCLSTVCPMETYFASRQVEADKEYKWGYNYFWLNADLAQCYLAMYEQVPSNKVLGYMFPNDADGLGDRTIQPPLYEAAGIKTFDGGAYQPLTENYTDSIAKFKTKGCELFIGDMIPPDFTNFWKQSLQQGYKPKAAGFMKGILFPEALEAVGDVGQNLITECWWHPSWPYRSSLSGETCQELTDHFQTTQNRQWTQPVGAYCLGEWAVDAFKRATNPDDKEAIAQAVKTTKLDTIMGPIDFTAPVDKNGLHPFPNGCRSPIVGSQWIFGSELGSKYKYEEILVANPTPWAAGVKLTGTVRPMKYS